MVYYVYILASRRHSTLYVGMTNDLVRRTWQHKEGVIDGFTKAYGVHHLVYLRRPATLQARSSASEISSAGDATGRSR